MAYTTQEKRILGTTSAAHFLTHLYELTFPALALTMHDDLGWSLGDVLRLSFLMYLLFGLGALPFGLLADRWRAKGVLVIAMLGSGVGCLLVSRAQSEAGIIGALAIVGVCISGYHPAGMSLLSRFDGRRGRALGLNGVFGNLGSAMAPLVAGVLGFEFGWRTAYVFLGALGLVAGLVTLCIPLADGARTTQETASQPEARGRTGNLIGAFAVLCVAMMIAGLAYRGVALVLPATFEAQTTFLRDILQRIQVDRLEGISNLAATLIASGVYAVGMIGQVVGGHIADRHDLRKAYLIFHAASFPFVLAMGFCSEWALVLVAGAYVFFALGMQPIENSLVASLTPERWRSTSYGVKFVLNFGVGSLAVYGVTALNRDGSFLSVYASVAVLVFLVCLVATLLLRRTHSSLTHPDSSFEALLS